LVFFFFFFKFYSEILFFTIRHNIYLSLIYVENKLKQIPTTIINLVENKIAETEKKRKQIEN